MVLAQLWAGFQSLLLLPTSKLGLCGAHSWVGVFVYVLGPCGSLQRWEFLLLPSQPPPVFSIRDLRLYLPALEPWVAWSVSLPSCSSWFIRMQMWDCPLHQPPPCFESSLHQLPASTPPTDLDGCFFFNSLVVRLPYSSIFWQFWLFFVFRFVVLLIVRGGRVYLPMPPSWPEVL